ncbi:hypothetical protein [Clostridium perfringens]|uniref:hypothetical protein n=1 Tax=Clostridium perfringens TaxID=1502 RepID=UPI003747D377
MKKSVDLEFIGINSNDYYGFCWDVDREAFINIVKRKLYDYERNISNRELYSITPDSIYDFGNAKCRIKLSVEVIEK